MVCKTVEIILNWKILSEVEEVFKLVTVCIELTVEVLCDEPVGLKQLFRTCKTKCAEKKTFKLIV